ncbi:efflux RND transporter periplasmic adaptor subunit [Roseomonas sp. PWR1]|uniref:Efflux RND transporter periplasmic adaptor subunit n=1 Tax=Roseomonas nitratireducens TaxID=2820810 RepID=A0ABS4AS15_9PROT|nr:efflux RND transporter periplasmic adaptor subunit [Neoroseomonas nitratireducens]MBP0464154.1 efflux RND transporter periplasmic adaptor subunit [Neoroseomonas nitratireducens]
MRSNSVRVMVLAVGFVALAGVLAACKDQAPPAQQTTAAPPAVFVTRVERRAIAQEADFIGRVEAIDKVEVRARVTGFLYARHFNEGDRVKAGELLFTIEQAPYAAEVSLRQAQLDRAEAELRNASLQVERGRELVRTNNIPQSTLDERIAAEGQARGERDAAKAQLDQARIQYGYTEIRVPFDGRAGRSPLSPGNVVGPETGILVTIVRDDPIRVSFPVTQRELLRVRRAGGAGGEGAQVLVRLPDGTMMDTAGRLEFLDVTANRSTDSVLVQASVPNPQRLLTDGQAVTVVVREGSPREVITVPQSALNIDQQGPFVLVVGADNKVEVKRIRSAPGPAGQVVVTEGLEVGQMVITEGSQRARPGQPVTPRPHEAPPGATPASPARGG